MSQKIKVGSGCGTKGMGGVDWAEQVAVKMHQQSKSKQTLALEGWTRFSIPKSCSHQRDSSCTLHGNGDLVLRDRWGPSL